MMNKIRMGVILVFMVAMLAAESLPPSGKEIWNDLTHLLKTDPELIDKYKNDLQANFPDFVCSHLVGITYEYYKDGNREKYVDSLNKLKYEFNADINSYSLPFASIINAIKLRHARGRRFDVMTVAEDKPKHENKRIKFIAWPEKALFVILPNKYLDVDGNVKIADEKKYPQINDTTATELLDIANDEMADIVMRCRAVNTLAKLRIKQYLPDMIKLLASLSVLEYELQECLSRAIIRYGNDAIKPLKNGFDSIANSNAYRNLLAIALLTITQKDNNEMFKWLYSKPQTNPSDIECLNDLLLACNKEAEIVIDQEFEYHPNGRKKEQKISMDGRLIQHWGFGNDGRIGFYSDFITDPEKPNIVTEKQFHRDDEGSFKIVKTFTHIY